jgi:HK97 family phage major capsid protein/HK97 family phage prohead protease
VLTRAYAVLTVKAVDPIRRTIAGMASTPEVDRSGDVVEPLGITYKNPLPLLLYHDSRKPVGTVTFQAPTSAGLAFTADLPTVDEPGTLRDRVEEAWQSIKAGLLAGVSIGFRSMEEAFNKETGGFRFLKTEILELSLVAIPANAGATISSIKALDLAASGRDSSRDRGTPIVRADKGARAMEHKKTIRERIADFEYTRTAKCAELEAIQQTATDESRTKSEAEREKFDLIKREIESINAELADLRDLEKIALTKAQPVTATTAAEASAQRSVSVSSVQISSPLPKATAFIRYCQALAVSHGSTLQAVEFAKRWHDSTPEVELVLKAAVAAGTTTDASWAGPLAPIQPLAADFLALLRPQTILGKVDTFFRVPFNVSVPAQTGGGTYQWVGQGAPKPVGKLAFATITLSITKCAGIIVITEELARTSTPSAEEVIRRDMIAGIAAFLDAQFIDPTVAAVAGVSPGSVTNGVTPITTAGPTPANARTDIQALANAMTAALIPSAGAVLILSETNALALINALNPLGQPLFPGMAQGGGMIMGYKAIASQAAGTTVALVQPSAIMYADDGGVTIDISREASLQMDTALDNPPLATTVMTSLWQNNLIGLRAERFINWKKARTGVVQYTVATYTA